MESFPDDLLELPLQKDLYWPALRALGELGTTALDDLITELMKVVGISEEQMAVEYPTGGGRSKVRNRIQSALSVMKANDMVDNPASLKWGITEYGRSFLANENGEAELQLDLKSSNRSLEDPSDFLLRVDEDLTNGSQVVLHVRELISEWGAQKRGRSVVDTIRSALDAAGFVSDPDFEKVALDDIVELKRADSINQEAEIESEAAQIQGPAVSQTITVGNLTGSSKRPLVTVAPSDDLLKARSLMESHDYSQLAVVSGQREITGSVSWESIARASMHSSEVKMVKDAMETNPEVVHYREPLLDHVHRIAASGFVFVLDREQRPAGIVTTADLSLKFAETANPFLIIGEIEGRLRRAIDLRFDPAELQQHRSPDDPEREVFSAADLTFGEYVRLLQNPQKFERLDWNVDRKVFLTHMGQVKEIRNDIMHFGPDTSPDDDVRTLLTFRDWLRRLP